MSRSLKSKSDAAPGVAYFKGNVMAGKLILRGLFAGLIGGVLAFAFARIFAEPQIQAAIDYEGGRDAAQETLDSAAGLHAGMEMADPFSRTVQAWPGIGTGLILMALAMGGLFAVVFMLLYGRIGEVRARVLSVLIAVGAFLAIFFIPFLKYPANPPAVGHHETIGQRTLLYGTMVVASLILGVAAVAFGRWLHRQRGCSLWNATLIAGGGFVVAIGAVMLALPTLGMLAANVIEYGAQDTETPLPLLDEQGNIVFPGFPADLLYQFRLYSVGTQLILWGAIALVFGPLAERLVEPGRRDGSRTVPATAAAESR